MALNIQQSIFTEIADFLVSQPSLEMIASYQVPASVQQHIDYLLEKNSDASLSADEKQELEKILVIADLMNLAKAKAMLKMVGKT